MADINDILKTIDDAVNRLSNVAAAKENPIFKAVINMLAKLQTKNDALLNNIANLKLINQIKNKIERLIIDEKYKQELKVFVGAFNNIAALQNEYFAKFSAKFKPKQSLKVLTRSAIESTVNSLTEVGVQSGITDGLKKIMLTNVQAGGDLASLTEQLREHITTTNTPGAFEKYVRGYTITALSTFSRKYNRSIATDLNLYWHLYVGSLLETSREFCIKAVAKKHIHTSEYETLLRGDFGTLGKIHVNKKTGLPPGLIDGTTPDNFEDRAGGWSCPHNIIAVADSAVPISVQDEVYSSSAYQSWALRNGKDVKKPSMIKV